MCDKCRVGLSKIYIEGKTKNKGKKESDEVTDETETEKGQQVGQRVEQVLEINSGWEEKGAVIKREKGNIRKRE